MKDDQNFNPTELSYIYCIFRFAIDNTHYVRVEGRLAALEILPKSMLAIYRYALRLSGRLLRSDLWDHVPTPRLLIAGDVRIRWPKE